jgi:hypothetical protein
MRRTIRFSRTNSAETGWFIRRRGILQLRTKHCRVNGEMGGVRRRKSSSSCLHGLSQQPVIPWPTLVLAKRPLQRKIFPLIVRKRANLSGNGTTTERSPNHPRSSASRSDIQERSNPMAWTTREVSQSGNSTVNWQISGGGSPRMTRSSRDQPQATQACESRRQRSVSTPSDTW